MKLLTIISFAIALAAGSTTAVAKGRDHDSHQKNQVNRVHQGAHHSSRGHKSRHDRAHHRTERRHYTNHRRNWHRAPRLAPRYSYRHGWRHSSRYGWGYRYNYYPSLLGASLIGTVIGHHLYHLHDGAVCYDSHNDDHVHHDRTADGDASHTEIVGCHRVERLPDGSERRVEVPLSQCH